MSKISEAKNSRRIVRTFSWASFLNDMGSDMISSIWPLFVLSFTGVNMQILGLIDGIGGAIVSISQAVSGYLSDRLRKRKVFIWTGYLFAGFSRIGYALSITWHWLIPFRIMDRSGKMRGSPRDAIIADISTVQTRGRNFGFLRMMDNLGAVFGIIISILLIQYLGYKTVFMIAAIPSVLGALLVIFFIKERPFKKQNIFKGIHFSDLNKNFRLFLISSAIFALGSFSYSFLLIYAKNFGFSETFVPILYLIFTLMASIFSIPFGKLTDRIGRKKVVGISFLFWILTCLTLIFVRSYLGLIFIFILYGIHLAAKEVSQKTFVSELVPIEFRASGLGGFQMVIGLAALPSSFLAGFLWDRIGILVPLYFSLGLTIIAFFMLMFVKDTKRADN
ncbi:MFS transporter [Patescibacteria group bacterium]|nr:MFS transporter [Patescibacteria group bacterium]